MSGALGQQGARGGDRRLSGPQRGLFVACLGVGALCLVLLDAWFAPAAIAVNGQADGAAGPEPSAAFVVTKEAPPSASTVHVVVEPATRVPTIVARFESEAKEPTDQTAIRALATVMIEDHGLRVVLEGHSDTRGAEDFNHDISLARAEWVKARLIELGVSEDRVEAVGLGATRPLRSDEPDAQSVNRRVEIRWVGR